MPFRCREGRGQKGGEGCRQCLEGNGGEKSRPVTCSPGEGQSQKGKAEEYERNSSSRLRLRPPDQEWLLFFWEAGLFYLLGEPTGADRGPLGLSAGLGAGCVAGCAERHSPGSCCPVQPPGASFYGPLVVPSHLALVFCCVLRVPVSGYKVPLAQEEYKLENRKKAPKT